MLKGVLKAITGMDVPVLGLEGTLATLASSGTSLVRWGDGESAILRGRGISFQAWDPELRDRLAELLEQKRPNILLGIPANALRQPLWHHIRRPTWLATRFVLAPVIRRDRVYADAFIFRNEPRRALAALAASLEGMGFVIVVSSNPDDAAFLSMQPGRVTHIAVPPRNAFSTFASTCAQIRGTVDRLRATAPNSSGVVLISAGPTAKALVSELSDEVICYDLGHIFHFARNGAKKNVWTR